MSKLLSISISCTAFVVFAFGVWVSPMIASGHPPTESGSVAVSAVGDAVD